MQAYFQRRERQLRRNQMERVVFYHKADIILRMQQMSLKCITGAMLWMVLGGQMVRANVDANPYTTIVDRNPFGLKPPPPPPPPPEQIAPPVPLAKVTLTGLVSMFGEPRALLEIIEEPGKGAGTAKKPILREGERLGAVEVLAIDVVKNTVRIRNSGVETNMTFEVAKAGPAAGGPGVPSAPKAYKPAALATPQPPAQPSAPTIISANGANPGGGVTLVGGSSVSSSATPSATANVPSPLGASVSGGPTIPARPLRTESAAQNSPPMTRDQAALLIEAQRLRGGPPLPPTHLTPIIEGAQQEGAQPNPSPFPRFPSAPRGRPNIPGR